MNKPELLAPAGTFEKAKIAFMYGADAVYCGTSKHSLRTRTAMDFEDLKKTVHLAHSLNKRVHVAMNVYARDDEYDGVIEEVKELSQIGIDGFIVADPGVVDIIKEYAPNIDIHISTQANTVSAHTCKFWANQGAKRVILARELSKDEIKYIVDNKPEGLEIEMFAHGAICYSYSGRCYLSDYMAGRSANHGDCAQPCRWSYNLYAEEKNKPGEYMPVDFDEKGIYIFSSKDMCLMPEIPTIFDLGVDSLKIEGRLKTEYYVATIVNAYRHAIDEYANAPEGWNYEKYMVEIEKAKTRALTEFYFKEKYNPDTQDLEGKQINPNYEFGGIVITGNSNIPNDYKMHESGYTPDFDENKLVTVEIRNKLSVGDKLEVMIPGILEPQGFIIDRLYDYETESNINEVNPGVKEQKVKLKFPFEVKEDYIIRRIK